VALLAVQSLSTYLKSSTRFACLLHSAVYYLLNGKGHVTVLPKIPLPSGRENVKRNSNSLINIDLSTLDVPFRWINLAILDQGGVEFLQIDAESGRFIVIVNRKMGDDIVSTRTWIEWGRFGKLNRNESGGQTSLCPAQKIVCTTLWHPAILSPAINVAVHDLGKFYWRMQSHKWVKGSELNQGKHFVTEAIYWSKMTNGIPTIYVGQSMQPAEVNFFDYEPAIQRIEIK